MNKLDPLIVAKVYNDEYISLICALFSYGNVKAIINFLNKFDFSLLDENEQSIKKALSKSYYRFQNSQDIIELFITLRRLKLETSIEDIIYSKYKINNNILDGLFALINKFKQLNNYTSRGYSHLIGKVAINTKTAGAYKRYMLYLRWMVRSDFIDMGLWSKIDTKDLLVTLDTHSFNIAKKLHLTQRNTCDLQTVIEVTNSLKELDKNDPTKYEFSLYRLGQEKIL
jgi:uncharacterized protein (TIGR02757 family)